MQWFRVGFANLLWFCYSTVQARKWKHATRDVAGAQLRVLKHILTSNADCTFGQEHKFATLQTVEAYQQRVALRSYEAFEPYIQRIAEGQPAILTTDLVQQFGLTSGSTQASKLIPYTKALVNEFQEGIDPWVHYLFRGFPQLLSGKTYWSVTPVGERKSHTTGGVPIGSVAKIFKPIKFECRIMVIGVKRVKDALLLLVSLSYDFRIRIILMGLKIFATEPLFVYLSMISGRFFMKHRIQRECWESARREHGRSSLSSNVAPNSMFHLKKSFLLLFPIEESKLFHFFLFSIRLFFSPTQKRHILRSRALAH